MVLSNSQWLANAGAAYEIGNSLRLDGTGDMSRTVSSDGNLRTWTFSFWLKRSTFGTNGGLGFNVGGTYVNGDNRSIFRFHSTISGGDDDWYWAERSGGAWREDQATTIMYRDPSAWSHYMCVWDTDGGTTPRARRYVNGESVDNYLKSGGTAAAANVDSGTNQAGTFQLFDQAGFPGREFEGYCAEMHFVDGTALGPSSFGETNDDGVWIPKAYTGSYGSNGFHLDFADSSDLGKDVSGNGNNFTSSGLATTDQMLDTPTNNYCTMNVLDNGRPANITVSDGNLTCAFAGAGYNGGIRSSFFFDSEDSDGWYAECTLDSLAFASVFRAGVANASLNLASNDAQTSADGWAYSDQGAKLNNSYTTGYGSAVTATDVVGIAVRNGKIYFAINNTWQGSANPVTESNPAFSNLTGDVAFCQSTNTGGSYAHTATWNFGQTGFTYTPPTGYKALNTANLPTPSITDGSAYFQPVLYTGSTSAHDITFSGNSDLAPDWLWFKARSAASNHFLFDKIRGALQTISSDDTTAEVTSTGSMTAFGTDGFSLGDGGSDNDINGVSGTTYVAWGWAANGSGSSNTDGSINTTATSVNATAGFSIIEWSGTGANGTIGHGLGVQPSLYILKNTATTNSWIIGSTLYAATSYLSFNTDALATGDAAVFNSTHPTSSVINLGSNVGTNGASGTGNMICYAFAEIPGYSSIGVYTGNGSTDGSFVYTGFKPAFVILKRTNATQEWQMYDTERDPFNVSNHRLQPNSSAAESILTSDNNLDFLSNGFKLRQANGGMNASGAPYIYMAFAENPFGGDGVAPATAR